MSVNISFLNAVQAVAKDNTVVKMQGVSIDRQAAVAVMKVYDSLDEGMKEEFMSRPVAHVVAIAKDLVKSFNTEKLSPVQKKIVAHRIPGMLVKAAQENTALLGSVGIAIGTDSEDMLKASAEEKGLVYADLDSDKITKDSLEIENRVAKWLEKEFGNVSLQGHSNDDLLGDMQIYRNMDKIEDSIDRQEPLRTSSGTLSLNDIPDLFDGLNYPDLYNDISVEFYDLQKEPEMEMDQASVTASKNLPSKGTPDWHEHKIAVDTVKNPAKAFLGGPSFKESVDTLKEKFGYSDEDIAKLERGVTAAGKRYTDNEWVLAEALRGKPNTKIYEENGKVVVKLYDTVIAKWDPAANTVELASGGFLTETTKTRINEILTVLKFHSRVMMKKGSWFVSEQGGESLPYEEGFVVTSAAGVSATDLEDMIKRFNEAGSTFYLGGVSGAYELWAKNLEGKDVRIDSGTRKDIKEALIKNRYNEKYRVKASKQVQASKYSNYVEAEFGKFLKETYPEIYRSVSDAIKARRSVENIHSGKAVPADFEIASRVLVAYDNNSLGDWVDGAVVDELKSVIEAVLPDVKYYDTVINAPKSKDIEASKKVKADAMANDMELGDWDAVVRDLKDSDGANATNRVRAEDPGFENPEYVEYGSVDGVPVEIFYRLTPEDMAVAQETGDEGQIPWESRIVSIGVDLIRCDKEDIPDEKIAEVLDKYNPSEKVKASKKTTAGGGAGVGFKVKDLESLYFDLQGDTLVPQGDFSKCIDLLEVDGYEEGLRVLDDDAPVYFVVTSIEISEIPVKELATLKEDPADASGIALDAGYSTLTGMIWRGWVRGKPEDAVVTVEDYVNFYTNSGFQFEGKLTMTIKFTEEGVNWYYNEFLQQDDPEPEDDEDPTDLDTESLEVKSSERKYAPKPVNNKVYASTKVNEAVPQEVMDSYLEAALWTEEERFQEDNADFDSNIHTSFSDEFLERAKQDLGKFFEDNKEAIEQFLVDEGQDLTQIAHSFWLTRNGHGAGFMDFGSDSARELDEAAKSFPEMSMELSGDGLVYGTPGRPLNDFKRKAAKEIKSDEDLSMDMFTFGVDDIEISDPSADFTFTLDGKVYEGRITTNRAYRGRGGELNLNSVDFDDPTAEEELGEDMVSFISDFIAGKLEDIFNGAPENKDDEVLADTFDS